MTTQTEVVRQLEIPTLHMTEPEALPFGDGSLSIRAFLLERPAGNLLAYSTTGLAADASLLAERGPIVRHYLSHWHEAMFFDPEPGGIDAPLVVHDADRDEVGNRVSDPVHAFTKRHLVDADLEVIPIPGHTPGATAYLWRTGGHRLLFTGDSIFVRRGRWVAAVLDSSDRRAYADSLELIADLDFDVMVPWAAESGSPPFVPVAAGEARVQIAAILERVRAGGDG